MKILDYIVGFRSRNTKSMIAAGAYYLFAVLLSIAAGRQFLFSLILMWSIPFIVFAVRDARETHFKSLVQLPVCAVLIIVSAILFPGKIAVEAITLPAGSYELENPGERVELQLTVTPENADISELKLISEDTAVARFEEHTLVGVARGETEIYAVCGNVESVHAYVKVRDIEAERAEKAQAIADKIAALGEISLESGEDIGAAEAAYNEAEDEVKAKVANAAQLTAAREQLTALEEEKIRLEQEEQARLEAERLEQERLEAERLEAEQQAQKNAAKKQAAAPQAGTGGGSGTVYVGKTGTKYHTKDCPTLKGKGIAIPIEKAKAQKRTACKVCGG